jgi:hypothetical protein
MRTLKVTITMDEDVVVEARRVAGEGGLSPFINALVAQRLQQHRMLGLLAEMEVEHGPIDPVAWQEARTELATLTDSARAIVPGD